MKKIGQIIKTAGLAGILALTSACATKELPFIPFKTNAGEKELVKTPSEVIANARKYSFPIYVLRKDGQAVSYYTEGVVSEVRTNIGKVEYGYESSNNFWLFDDDIYNGPRTFNDYYTVESYNPK
jgi:hypothetical protein